MNDRERIQLIQKKSLQLFENNKILYNNDDDYITILSDCIEDIKLNNDTEMNRSFSGDSSLFSRVSAKKNTNNDISHITDKLYEMHNCIQKYILFNEKISSEYKKII